MSQHFQRMDLIICLEVIQQFAVGSGGKTVTVSEVQRWQMKIGPARGLKPKVVVLFKHGAKPAFQKVTVLPK